MMVKPEATLRLLKRKTWGAKAMEHRVIRCCADNPECLYRGEYDNLGNCLIKGECKKLYDAFVDTIEDSRKEIYHQLRDFGVGSVEARANLSATRVKDLSGDGHG
jgi:hypothetical protein